MEGIVESDWTTASFTINWMLTRPDHLVHFERGEPICMIIPYPRGLLDELFPCKESLENNAELADSYRRWSADRDEFHRQMAAGNQEVLERGWQKDYFQGGEPGSHRVDEHQTELTVRPLQSARHFVLKPGG